MINSINIFSIVKLTLFYKNSEKNLSGYQVKYSFYLNTEN